MSFEIGAAHRTVPHLLADLIELLLVVGYEGRAELSKATVEAMLANSVAPPEEIDFTDKLEAPSDGDADAEGDAVRNEVLPRFLEEAWKQLDYRERAFGNGYPFIVSGDSLELRGDLSQEQRTYVFLLACSRLRSFPPVVRLRWAASFAKLSAVALRTMLPEHASVRIFDVGSDDRRDFYGQDFREALKVLGSELHATSIDERICAQQSSSGDGGIDLVGVVPFEDGANTTMTVLGQCAAREREWPAKTLEASPARIGGYFHLQHPPSNIVFIPVCYRDPTGQWINEAKTAGCILMDRRRIMQLVRGSGVQAIVNEPWFSEFEETIEAIAS